MLLRGAKGIVAHFNTRSRRRNPITFALKEGTDGWKRRNVLGGIAVNRIEVHEFREQSFL